MNRLYPKVAKRAGYVCEYCHAPQEAFNLPFEVEHIEPVSAGGTSDDENLALACRSRNGFKAAQQQAQDTETGELTSLYHPRRDEWHEHFSFNPQIWELEAKTAVGRVTIARLHLNSPAQRLARRHWVRMDLFP